MKDCRLDCFNCPYDDCKLDGMRIEDYDSEMPVDKLLGNRDDLRRTRKARHYALNREEFRIRNRKFYQARKQKKKGEKP